MHVIQATCESDSDESRPQAVTAVLCVNIPLREEQEIINPYKCRFLILFVSIYKKEIFLQPTFSKAGKYRSADKLSPWQTTWLC